MLGTTREHQHPIASLGTQATTGAAKMPADSDIANTATPKPSSLAAVFLRIIDHWFGPTADKWHWSLRFAFTFAGSATFFFAWFVYIGPYAFQGTPDKALDFYLFIGVIAIPGAIWFAGITAWKDLSYGPVRLYISGFLLPYFVWTLISFMVSRPRLEFGA